LNRLETFLALIVVGALGYVGYGMVSAKPGGTCSPVSLSQEVKAYIDSKVVASGGSQCSEIPKLVAKLADLQTKIGGIEQYRTNKSMKDAKYQQLAEATAEFQAKAQRILAAARASEVENIKRDITNVCSNQTPDSNHKRNSPGAGREGK
jgi:hypothetical protein